MTTHDDSRRTWGTRLWCAWVGAMVVAIIDDNVAFFFIAFAFAVIGAIVDD